MFAVSFATAAATALAGTSTWNGAWDTLPASEDDAIVIASGGDLTWSNTFPHAVASWTQSADFEGTVLFETRYGASGFTNFTVNGNVELYGGAWTHPFNTTAEEYRLRVTLNGHLLVTNAVIHADHRGYDANQGDGKPGFNSICGGAHGGAATRFDYTIVNGNTYGSIEGPKRLGSGGVGAKGGGALWLRVTGTTTVATGGTLSADGAGASNGAGAGGSILLETGMLRGGGIIRAHGGLASNSGDGAGGRVAIVLTESGADFSFWNGTDAAYGGWDRPAGAAAGTVYRRQADGEDFLIIDNNGKVTYNVSTRMPENVDLHAFSNVVIRGQGVLGTRADTVLNFSEFAPLTDGPENAFLSIDADTGITYPNHWLVDGYTLLGHGISKPLTHVTVGTNGVLSHFSNGDTETHALDLTVTGHLVVLTNGAIRADARGHRAARGPGAGSGHFLGGAHGGTSDQTMQGYENLKTYGSIAAPTNLGSGGSGGWGGGAIRLNVAGTTTVHAAATISADGGYGGNGPGSGGSVSLRTGFLSGAGTLHADGGNAGNLGNAGGGRVAVVLTGESADFSGWEGQVTAYGGLNVGYGPGAAGTVYLADGGEPECAGEVIVDNGTRALNATYTALPAFSDATEDLGNTRWATRNKARIGLTTHAAIESLTLTEDGRLELAGHQLRVKALTVNGQGFPSGEYTPADIEHLSDGIGDGVLIVDRTRGTLMIVR